MPDTKSDEAAAMRDVAWTAQAFLEGTADRNSLQLAVRTWLARREKLAKAAFRSTRRRGVATSDVEASQRTVAKQPQEHLETRAPDSNPSTEPGKPPAQSAGPKGKSWLTPYGDAWKARFGANSVPPWGNMARILKPLVATHGDAVVVPRFVNFLAASEVRYVNLWRFQATFDQWETADPDAWRHDPTAPRPGESTDAYITRLTR